MYAIVTTGGKQYKVAQGDVINVEKLDAQPGDKVELDVLMLNDDPEESPDAEEEEEAAARDFTARLNPDSLKVMHGFAESWLSGSVSWSMEMSCSMGILNMSGQNYVWNNIRNHICYVR